MMDSPATATRKLSPPVFSLPNKKLKLTPPSPPILDADCPPPAGVEEADIPSIFDVLNIFRCRWFLNRDHLIANILSAQKDDRDKLFWVDFQPQFHTHLVRRALALLPALCPVALGKRCMFVFLLEVLDEDGPGPYGSGSFFAIEKKASRARGPRRKPTPPGPSPPSQPPLSAPLPASVPLSTVPKTKKKKTKPKTPLGPWPAQTPAAPLPPVPVAPVAPSPPVSVPSPLSPLPLSRAESSHVSPEFVVSRTPTPRPPPAPLAPLNPIPSPVTLSQVEDVVATSDMVRDLQSHYQPSSPLSAPSSPPMFGDMEWEADPDPHSRESSEGLFVSWVSSHPAPTDGGSPLRWKTWFTGALRNEVTEEALTEFVKTLAFTQNAMIWDQFVQNRLSALADAVREWKDDVVSSWHKPPIPGT
jgi:hypothetical protein